MKFIRYFYGMRYFSIILLFLFTASCSNKFSVQKRRYTKGFYFNSSHIKQTREPVNNKIGRNKSKTLALKSTDFVNDSIEYAERELVQQINSEVKSEPKLPFLLSTSIVPLSKKVFHQQSRKLIGKAQKIKVLEPETKAITRVLFIVVSILAGLFFITALWALVLYASTLGLFYLIVAVVSLVLALLFFLISNKMNEPT